MANVQRKNPNIYDLMKIEDVAVVVTFKMQCIIVQRSSSSQACKRSSYRIFTKEETGGTENPNLKNN